MHASVDTELFKDKIEVSLDGRQIFYLFFGGAVIASMVFVLGVMVGRRVEARSYVERNAATSSAADPLAALDQLEARTRGQELGFAAALRGGGDEPLGSVDEKLAPAVEQLNKAVPAKKPEHEAKDKEAKKLEHDKDKGDKDKGDKDKAAKAAAPVAANKAVAVAAPAEDVVDGPKEDAKRDEAKAKKSGKFTLQLSSFQDEDEAQAFEAKLKAGGHRPYTVKAEVEDKGTWYRVRLGRFESYDDAVAAKADFEAKANMIAYVTRIRR